MNKKAFTLVELLATIVIIAMLAGIAAISYTSLINKADTTVYEAYEDTMYSEAAYKLTMHYNDVNFSNNKAKLSLNDLEIDLFKNPDDSNDVCPRSFVEVTKSYVGSVLNMEYLVCLVCNGYNNDGSNCKKYPQRERVAVPPSSIIANVDFPSCSNHYYNGSDQLLFQAHSSGGYTNSAIYGKNIGTYIVYLKPQNGYVWSDNGSSTTRELQCKIIEKPKQTPYILVYLDNSITYPNGITKTISTNSDGTLSCQSSNNNIVSCSIDGRYLRITPQAYNSEASVTISISVSETNDYRLYTKTYSLDYIRKVLDNCPSFVSTYQYTGETYSSGYSCPTNSTLESGGSGSSPGVYYQVCRANPGYKFPNGNTCEIRWEIYAPTPTPNIRCNVTCNCYCGNGSSYTRGGTLSGENGCAYSNNYCRNTCLTACSYSGLSGSYTRNCSCS